MKPATLLGPVVVPGGNGDPVRGGIGAGAVGDVTADPPQPTATPVRSKMTTRFNVATSSKTPESYLIRCKCQTQRIAFTAGIVVGIVVSAMGICALALFIHPDQIEALAGWQRPLFIAVDVVVTGAMIGGGADGIHKIISVFTNFLDTTSANLEAKRPPESSRV